jgi:diadenosine tetraphosphate (Ap4A) HIT family hydrolase
VKHVIIQLSPAEAEHIENLRQLPEKMQARCFRMHKRLASQADYFREGYAQKAEKADSPPPQQK